MQNWILVIVFAALFASPIQLQAQYSKNDSKHRKFFIGSTFFVLGNLIPDDNSPDFLQLNLGYRLGPKNAISLELKTWKYAWPLGIPYGNSFENEGKGEYSLLKM